MNQTPKEFDQCDKHALARSIWLTKRSETTGLRLICKLALDFGFDDYQLWNNALFALHKIQDLDYLFSLLLYLESSPKHSNLESVMELVEPVVLACVDRWFSNNRSVVGSTRFQILIRYLQVGSTSRFVDDRFGFKLWEKTKAWVRQSPFDPSRYVVGYFCHYLVLTDSEQEDYSLLYQDLSSEQVFEIMDCLTKMASQVTSLVEIKSKLEQSIFDWLNKNCWYSQTASTRYMTAFVKHLATNDAIHNLLNATVELGRYEDALKLLEVYFKVHLVTETLSDAEMIHRFQEKHPTFIASPLLEYATQQDD
jgi:hypothetical protein